MATVEYDVHSLKRDVTNLLRLPTGDRLSLNQFFEEAQTVLKRARAANLELPPVVTSWLAQADLRAKDPALAASQNSELVLWLRSVP